MKKSAPITNLQVVHHWEDIPHDVSFGNSVAVDTEAMGLNLGRDRLCLIQLSDGDGVCHLVQFSEESKFSSPNLKSLMQNPNITKIFHFARFDLSLLEYSLEVELNSVYCTKIASKLVRTYTDRHGLRELCRELLGIDLSKQEQSSDWGNHNLTPEQKKYAALDVFYLHKIKERLDNMLEREGKTQIAQKCFDTLPLIARLDQLKFDPTFVFGYN